jgi:uncharacterized protein YcnI
MNKYPAQKKLPTPKVRPLEDPEAISMTPIPGWTATPAKKTKKTTYPKTPAG